MENRIQRAAISNASNCGGHAICRSCVCDIQTHSHIGAENTVERLILLNLLDDKHRNRLVLFFRQKENLTGYFNNTPSYFEVFIIYTNDLILSSSFGEDISIGCALSRLDLSHIHHRVNRPNLIDQERTDLVDTSYPNLVLTKMNERCRNTTRSQNTKLITKKDRRYTLSFLPSGYFAGNADKNWKIFKNSAICEQITFIQCNRSMICSESLSNTFVLHLRPHLSGVTKHEGTRDKSIINRINIAVKSRSYTDLCVSNHTTLVNRLRYARKSPIIGLLGTYLIRSRKHDVKSLFHWVCAQYMFLIRSFTTTLFVNNPWILKRDHKQTLFVFQSRTYPAYMRTRMNRNVFPSNRITLIGTHISRSNTRKYNINEVRSAGIPDSDSSIALLTPNTTWGLSTSRLFDNFMTEDWLYKSSVTKDLSAKRTIYEILLDLETCPSSHVFKNAVITCDKYINASQKGNQRRFSYAVERNQSILNESILETERFSGIWVISGKLVPDLKMFIKKILQSDNINDVFVQGIVTPSLAATYRSCNRFCISIYMQSIKSFHRAIPSQKTALYIFILLSKADNRSVKLYVYMAKTHCQESAKYRFAWQIEHQLCIIAHILSRRFWNQILEFKLLSGMQIRPPVERQTAIHGVSECICAFCRIEIAYRIALRNYSLLLVYSLLKCRFGSSFIYHRFGWGPAVHIRCVNSRSKPADQKTLIAVSEEMGNQMYAICAIFSRNFSNIFCIESPIKNDALDCNVIEYLAVIHILKSRLSFQKLRTFEIDSRANSGIRPYKDVLRGGEVSRPKTLLIKWVDLAFTVSLRIPDQIECNYRYKPTFKGQNTKYPNKSQKVAVTALTCSQNGSLHISFQTPRINTTNIGYVFEKTLQVFGTPDFPVRISLGNVCRNFDNPIDVKAHYKVEFGDYYMIDTICSRFMIPNIYLRSNSTISGYGPYSLHQRYLYNLNINYIRVRPITCPLLYHITVVLDAQISSLKRIALNSSDWNRTQRFRSIMTLYTNMFTGLSAERYPACNPLYLRPACVFSCRSKNQNSPSYDATNHDTLCLHTLSASDYCILLQRQFSFRPFYPKLTFDIQDKYQFEYSLKIRSSICEKLNAREIQPLFAKYFGVFLKALFPAINILDAFDLPSIGICTNEHAVPLRSEAFSVYHCKAPNDKATHLSRTKKSHERDWVLIQRCFEYLKLDFSGSSIPLLHTKQECRQGEFSLWRSVVFLPHDPTVRASESAVNQFLICRIWTNDSGTVFIYEYTESIVFERMYNRSEPGYLLRMYYYFKPGYLLYLFRMYNRTEPGYLLQSITRAKPEYLLRLNYRAEPGYLLQSINRAEPGYLLQSITRAKPEYLLRLNYRDEPGYLQRMYYHFKPGYLLRPITRAEPESMVQLFDRIQPTIFSRLFNMWESQKDLFKCLQIFCNPSPFIRRPNPLQIRNCAIARITARAALIFSFRTLKTCSHSNQNLLYQYGSFFQLIKVICVIPMIKLLVFAANSAFYQTRAFSFRNLLKVCDFPAAPIEPRRYYPNKTEKFMNPKFGPLRAYEISESTQCKKFSFANNELRKISIFFGKKFMEYHGLFGGRSGPTGGKTKKDQASTARTAPNSTSSKQPKENAENSNIVGKEGKPLPDTISNQTNHNVFTNFVNEYLVDLNTEVYNDIAQKGDILQFSDQKSTLWDDIPIEMLLTSALCATTDIDPCDTYEKPVKFVLPGRTETDTEFLSQFFDNQLILSETHKSTDRFQRMYSDQVSINNSRKDLLCRILKERSVYKAFLSALRSTETEICKLYTKRAKNKKRAKTDDLTNIYALIDKRSAILNAFKAHLKIHERMFTEIEDIFIEKNVDLKDSGLEDLDFFI